MTRAAARAAARALVLRRGLDRAAEHRPGSGSLELAGHLDRLGAGAGLEYTHHVRSGLRLFGRGAVRHDWGGSTDFEAIGGLRWQW